jgi:hypothetical protein
MRERVSQHLAALNLNARVQATLGIEMCVIIAQAKPVPELVW